MTSQATNRAGRRTAGLDTGVPQSGRTLARLLPQLLSLLLVPPGAMFAKASSSALLNPRQAGERALMLGQLDEAEGRLREAIAANGADGRAHLLLCRVDYAAELPDGAVSECEAALSTLGDNSEAHDWMGRAYGLKADRSGPVTGFKLARKVLVEFETAVRLDAKNSSAANDLSEYYISAPSVLGGGLDNASKLADSIQTSLPQAAHRIRAMVAEKRKDLPAAEREFRAAVGTAGRPDAWVDLEAFYGRRRQFDAMDDAARHSIAANRGKDASLVDAASTLMDAKQQPELAGDALRSYLSGNGRSDAAPAPRAHVLLGTLLARNGDKAGAKIEFNKALELKADYAPAKRALDGL